MKNIRVINENVPNYYQTVIRNNYSSKDEIKTALMRLGVIMGEQILNDIFLSDVEVITPMELPYKGKLALNNFSIIISTKSDFELFTKGCFSVLQNSQRGYMDFGNVRGQLALNTPVRAMSLPELPSSKSVDNLIILKSVLATGCTAISLTKKALEIYSPKRLIIASIFYSHKGLIDFIEEFPSAIVYLIGNPDDLNDDGMLMPGLGNIDSRIV